MKTILTGTLAALVLGASIAAQTPPAERTPAPAQPSGAQTQPADQGQTAGQQSPASKIQTTTYRGILQGSAASGFTITPIDTRAGASSTAGATATAGAGGKTTYTVVAAEGAKVNLASMADQCVEIAGVVVPGLKTSPSAGDAGATSRSASTKETLTVTAIKASEACKQ
ncbi:MAG: hypothetical protein EHM55_04025 [Acidobacteria bacterium]|nr:MAG: hypothetical protein EHM55_04025 [Acidobacteriota bacterium]